MLEIVFVLFGLITLISGKLPVSGSRVIRGTPARLLGLLYCGIIGSDFIATRYSAPDTASFRVLVAGFIYAAIAVAITIVTALCCSSKVKPAAQDGAAVGPKPRNWFRIVMYGVLGIGVLLLINFIRPNLTPSRETQRVRACQSNLKKIGQAMLAYHHEHGHFPPHRVLDENGEPLYSWRVLLLPYLGREDLYKKFNLSECWDSPTNSPLLAEMPAEYECPGMPDFEVGDGTTDFIVALGNDTMFPAKGQSTLTDTAQPDKTILVVEADTTSCFDDSAGIIGTGIRWSEPRDSELSKMNGVGISNDPGDGMLGSRHAGGIQAVFADGHVEALGRELAGDSLRAKFRRK